MRYILLLCCVSASIIDKCDGANILAYITAPFYSHQVTFRPLWEELAKRGHKITLLTYALMEENENITQVYLSDTNNLLESFSEKISSGEGIFKVIKEALNTFDEFAKIPLAHPKVQELLKNEKKIDLVITEFIMTLGFTIGKKLKAPIIGVISMDGHYNSHDAVGNPTHPIAYPDYDLPFFTNLNFKERVLSSLYSVISRIGFNFLFIPLQDYYTRKYIDEDGTAEVLRNISMLFINVPLFSNVRPLGPKTVNIGGGFHLLKPKQLPQDLQEYLDNSKEGVIYFNLGSSVKSMHLSNKTRNVILKTFSELPYQILWKFETDEFPGKSNNIKIEKWLPQQDVLRHKNVKLFITQGGLQSMEEAIFSYVPMIGMPFFGDQLSNTYKMEAKGCGLSLDFEKLEVETFKGAILEVINNPRYKEKTKELAELVLDQPMTGLEKAVWWTEYVLRHGGTEHFRDPIVDLPLYQYYLLDVISFLIVVLSLIIYVLYIILRLIKKNFVIVYVKLFTTQKIKKH